jgi:hypothetical protein
MGTHRSSPAFLSCLVGVALIATGVQVPTARAEGPIEPPIATEPAAVPMTLGPDEVELLDGGFVRGTIVEVTPKVRVVIIPDGTNARREIAWADIADVGRGKHAGGAKGEWPVEETPPPPPPKEEPGVAKPRVHLELTRPREVRLFEIDNEIVASGYYGATYGMQFRAVCTAPCDRVIDATRGQDFFLATGQSSMTTASRRFSLDGKQGDVTIRVKPGNRGLRIVGAVLLGIGIGCLIGGAALAVPKSTRNIGYVFLGIGAPSLIAGIPMTIFGRTRYELADTDDAEPQARR